jgi:DNA-binding NarL/FixJ family response regulator
MSNSLNSGREVASSRRKFQPPREHMWMWEALTEDSDAAVMVLDASGVIEYANERAVELHRLGSRETCIGMHLSEFLPASVVQDRFALAQEALAAGKPAHIRGMVHGVYVQCTFRMIEGDRILCTSRLAAPKDPIADRPPPGVIQAQVDDPGALGVLTNREMEILKLIGLGLSSAEIAKRLGRSVKTVEWHRVSLGDKLGVSNRVELARIAIGAGLVRPEPPKQGMRKQTN